MKFTSRFKHQLASFVAFRSAVGTDVGRGHVQLVPGQLLRQCSCYLSHRQSSKFSFLDLACFVEFQYEGSRLVPVTSFPRFGEKGFWLWNCRSELPASLAVEQFNVHN